MEEVKRWRKEILEEYGKQWILTQMNGVSKYNEGTNEP